MMVCTVARISMLLVAVFQVVVVMLHCEVPVEVTSTMVEEVLVVVVVYQFMMVELLDQILQVVVVTGEEVQCKVEVQHEVVVQHVELDLVVVAVELEEEVDLVVVIIDLDDVRLA